MIDTINLLDQQEVLALTIYGEARGELIQGQVAVGCVIRNRVLSKRGSYKNVCLEPSQFSCWNATDLNLAILLEIADSWNHDGSLHNQLMDQCVYVAKGIIGFNLLDNTGGAVDYMTSKLFVSDQRPKWALKVDNLQTIGNHVFFSVA